MTNTPNDTPTYKEARAEYVVAKARARRNTPNDSQFSMTEAEIRLATIGKTEESKQQREAEESGCPSEATRGTHAHVSNLQTLGHCPACTDDSHADGNDSPTKAVAYLGAVEVAPGRYAIPNPEPFAKGTWSVANAEWLESAAADGPAKLAEHLSHLNAMPSWWTPQTQYAWRHDPDDGTRYATLEDAENAFATPCYGQDRITADLTTGEEVPA